MMKCTLPVFTLILATALAGCTSTPTPTSATATPEVADGSADEFPTDAVDVERDPGPDIKSPGPDFGFIPNAIGIVDPGRFYLETSVEFDRDGSEQSYRVPMLLRAGIAEDWELRAELWAFQRERDDDGAVSGGGPLQLGFKHRLSRGGDEFFDPAFGFEVEVLLPVGCDAFHDGKVEPSLTFNFDHPTSPDGTFTWNLGAFTPVDEVDGQFVQGFFAAAYSHFVTPDIQLYVTGSANYPETKCNSGTAAVLGAGGYWYVSQRVVLYLGYNAGVTPDSTAGAGVIGITYAF